jgi:mycofactocin precursor
MEECIVSEHKPESAAGADQTATVVEPVHEPSAGAVPVAEIEADLLVEDVSIDGMCGVY